MASTPLIPLSFDPPVSSSEDGHIHLEFDEEGNNHRVKWHAAGVSLSYSPFEYSPSLEDVERLNEGIFRNWSNHGFSAGRFHEIFCGELPRHCSFKLGAVEVTFGEVSPLYAFLYEGDFDSKYHGEWCYYTSARILGCSIDEVESYFITAALEYFRKFSLLPEPRPLLSPDWFDEDEIEDAGADIVKVLPAYKEIDPLRFYYYGLTQADRLSSCIYYYRVLEYFAFLENQNEMSKLRHDVGVSDADFVRKMLPIVYRDEKGPILQLVNRLADVALIEYAATHKLIESSEKRSLGNALYLFRNSIVHGKQVYGQSLLSPTLFSSESSKVGAWRQVLEQLAGKALSQLGRRFM